MTADDAVLKFHSTASQIDSSSTSAIGFNGVTYRGISLIDSSDKTPGAAVAITAGTNATQPVYSTAATGRLVAGSIVRIQNTDQSNLGGLDFTVDAVTVDTEFRLANTLATAPGIVAGAAGTWRLIAPSAAVYDMFKPRNRVIANITAASPAVVTTLVDHQYTTGQKVRMSVPTGCGMVEMNEQLVTVTYLTASTFSVAIDASAFTAFAFPLPAAIPFSPALVTPVGIDTASNTSLETAFENAGFIGMILGTSGTAAIALGSPGGTTGDVIKWRAGKSFATDVPTL